MATSASAFLGEPVSAASFLDEAPRKSTTFDEVVTTRGQLPGLRPGFDKLTREQALAQIADNLRPAPTSVPLGALAGGFTPFPNLEVPASIAQPVATIGPRVALPIGAAALLPTGVGTLPGLAILAGAGGLGSLAGQAAEKEMGLRQNFSLPEAAVDAAVSAVPPARLGGIASPVLRAGIRGLEGGAIGTGQDLAMRAVRGEGQDLGESLKAGAYGAVLSSPFAALEAARPPQIPKSAQILAEPQTKTPSIANVATEVASQTPNSPYALQTQLNNMTTDQRRRVQQLQLEETFAGLPPKNAEESAAVFEQIGPLPPQKEAPPVAAELQTVSDIRAKAEAEKAAAGQAGVAVSDLEAQRAGAAMVGVGAERPLAPVEYVGVQEGLPATATRPSVPDIELFNLTEDIPGHPTGSTVSRQTLERAGFEVPTARELQTGGQPNASNIEGSTALGEQPGGTQGAGAEGRQGMESGNQGKGTAGDFLREGPVQEPRSDLGSERGAISPAAIAPLGGGVAGGVTGAALTEKQPGETEEEYQARKLKNALAGAAAGAGLGSIGALALGARGRRIVEEAETPVRGKRGAKVALPEGNVRQTAEKVIENRAYPEQLRRTLAEDPDILYDKFSLNDLSDRVRGATMEQLTAMSQSANLREKLGAIAELGNRYSVSNEPAKAAEMYSLLSQHMTNPAQILGLGKLVRSPDALVNAVNESLGPLKRTLSKTQADELRVLAANKIKTEQALASAEKAADQDFTIPNEQNWKKAQREAGIAAKAMDDYVHQVAPESWGAILSKIIQGNLLTPLSLANNVFGNITFQPVRRGAAAIASALDAIYSPLANKERVVSRGNPIPSMAELQAAGEGIRVAANELIHGPSPDSYLKSEVQRGFRPLRSLVNAFTGKGMAVRPDGTVALGDRAKKFVEGTLGIAPETMFRFLNLGDKPFRRAAQAEILMEQAREKGLKGRDLVKFMDFPDKATQELLDTEGRRAIFAQENKGVKKLNQFLDKGVAEMIGADKIPALKEAIKVFGRITVPFRQFPINYVTTAMSFVAPEVGLAKAAYYGSQGNRRKALTAIGESAMGAMMYGAANYLWDKGLISEPADKDAKKRSIQYDQIGPQRLNVSGLERSLSGGDPKWQSGDTTIDWGKLGIPSGVFYVYTKAGDREKASLSKTGSQGVKDNSLLGKTTDRLGDFLQMAPWALDQSMLSGTASLLEAIKEAPDAGPLHAWARNTFRAVSSIAVPNSIEALARAQYEYVPDLKGDTLGQTLKNTWDYKTLQLPASDRTLLKRDIWGDLIPRTPEGKNPYIHQFIDVTGSANKTITPWKKPLLDLFQETDSPQIYPTPPGRNFSAEGVTVQLEPADYELLQQVVGAYRKRGVEIITGSDKFQNARTPEEKIYLLDKMYDQAANAGRALLLKRPGFANHYFPELTGLGVPPEEQSHVVERNLPARARVRVMEETK